jgi:CRP/FNR family cyclic AMP-dependent transcriptional regulator
MYPIFGVPPEFEKIASENKKLIERFFSNAAIHSEQTLLGAQSTLYKTTGKEGMVYVLKEGIMAHSQKNRTLYFYDVGDLVGVQHVSLAYNLSIDSSNPEYDLTSDFAVLADEYRISDVYKSFSIDGQIELWHQILANYADLLNIIIFISAQTKLEVHPETITIEPGEVIIEQGSYGSDVYTLVEGHLEVLVDDVAVGEVMPDEIFGAMAALTETPRSATVRATELSVLLKLPRERFLDLMKSRPLTVMKMIEDMSRTIVALNQRVVDLSTKGI